MIRTKTKDIKAWYETKNRKVLHIRGMRQVGKTTIAINFLESLSNKYVMLDMSIDQDLSLFEEDILTVRNYREIILEHTGIPVLNDTMIFIDEIQKSPKAFAFIKHYKDERTRLKEPVNLIVSGSYVDTTVTINKHFDIPVGCIEPITIRPLSFYEFLYSVPDGDALIKNIRDNIINKMPITNKRHVLLMSYLKTYLVLGGMPDVINNYLASKMATVTKEDYQKVNHIIKPLNTIVELQRIDIQRNHFSSESLKKPYSQKILDIYNSIINAYKQGDKVGNNKEGKNITKFLYNYLKPTQPKERDYKEVIEHLKQGNIITMVHRNGPTNNKNYKLLYSDMGILSIHYGNKAYFENIIIGGENAGTIYEQFVTGELLSYGSEYENIWYWHKDKYEIDFMLDIPVDSKSGTKLKASSLDYYNKINNTKKQGIRITKNIFSAAGNYVNVPYYAVWLLKDIIKEVKESSTTE